MNIIQEFLDDVKQARAQGKKFLIRDFIFPQLFDGNTDHIKITRDDKQVIVEQIYSDETVKKVFDKWRSEQRKPIQELINRLLC